jgi:hypothetical protein
LTKNQEAKNLQNDKERLSTSKIHSTTSLKLRKKSNTGTKSSSQVIKEKLGDRRKKGPNQQILQETLQLSSKVQCGEVRSLQSSYETKCGHSALNQTGRM